MDLSRFELRYCSKIQPIEREVNLNADRKRLWLGRIESIDESSNESISLPLNFFSKEDI